MIRRLTRILPLALLIGLIGTALVSRSAFAQTEGEIAYAIDNFALFICAVLVLFMQAGFALLEVGFNASKNTVNILFKNFFDTCVGVVIFWLFGFSIMYGADVLGGFMGWNGFLIDTTAPEPVAGNLSPYVDFLFQVAFAATAATIVSGAVAGRIKFGAYIVYTIFITGLIYPIAGHWHWGGGWLAQMGFHDFAGSQLVHSVGGFAGLAGAMVLGPRIGRFAKESNKRAFAPSSYAFGALGVFILWIGWYGFNPGSVLAFVGSDNTNLVMEVAVNTTIAAAAGGIGALALAWIILKRADLGSALNGGLAGLVAITANADVVTQVDALLIGLVGGLLVVVGLMLLERLKIDDPVGAWPVHGFVGMWAGLATFIFGDYEGRNLTAQLIGTFLYPVWAFALSFGLFYALKAIGFLRVSPEEEEVGLDLTEHGSEAYSLSGLGAAAD